MRPFGNPMTYRLVKIGEGSSEFKEATFTVHGVILDKDLPPIWLDTDEQSKNRYAKFIRQYVAVTGIGLEEFSKVLSGLARVHQYFEDLLPANKLERLEPFSINGNLALACHTRYFQSRRHCRSADPHPFGPGVDPNDDLKQIGGDLYIHTEDNVVQYLARKIETGQSLKYTNIHPIRFQRGDIVEVNISFFCVQTRFGKFKMMTALRTLTLLDDKFRQV
ncbi:hypothetical protein BYT27DRAFT_7089134 [Phlegmacium glaucopus]|nr:hypothetical protein BYT27DRAFT_7089134 [Phlegmacium glaucopus]